MEQSLSNLSHSIHCNAVALLNCERMTGQLKFDKWSLPNAPSMHLRVGSKKKQPSIRHAEKCSFTRLSAMHFARADVHVDVGNVSASVLTQTAISLDRSQIWPRSFTFRFTPMIVSDLPNHQDADGIRPATAAAEANLSPRCKKKMRRLFALWSIEPGFQR